MTYEEAESYINNTPKFTKKNTLENTRMVLDAMDHPERKMKLIHVAGTNGKGSVCAYLSSILKAAGKEVGLFTSPHLVKINERFKINEEDVSDELFLEAFEGVMDLVRQLLKEKPEEFAHPTFFELLFLMGIYIFDKAHMEYVVLETGLGGRLPPSVWSIRNILEIPMQRLQGKRQALSKKAARSSMTEPGRMWKKPFLRRLPRCMRRLMPSVRTCIKF